MHPSAILTASLPMRAVGRNMGGEHELVMFSGGPHAGALA
ncbi:hypothetical protein AtDm6_1715 [Acetobacter tropicalis]|uniref:Uncharacterized protein n=1 Tax=Acetobacter tropicalis TaxID=104102 RepID=A0A094YMM8_9PROT|nr:hypothetical protein AtDm6_1715 [Acetobacter tropicalis]